MSITARSSITRPITRIKKIYRELDHAQRRLTEIQTGVRLTPPAAGH
jgi:hypothetical protein